MKRLAFIILALAIAFCSLVSCKKENNNNVEADDTTVESNEINNDLSNDAIEEDTVYSDGIIIEAYLPVLALYFHENYSKGDDLSEKDLFHLAAQFIYTQRSDMTASAPNDETTFAVKASDIENTAKALFGNGADLEDFSKFVNADLGERYDGENGVYYFTMDSVSYSPDGYMLSYDEDPDIKEDGKTIVATATVLDSEENSTQITYTFEKTVFKGYMYTKLIKAEK